MAGGVGLMRFVICKLSGEPIGEVLDCQDQQHSRAISRMRTASARIRLDNPLVGALMDTTQSYRCRVHDDTGPLLVDGLVRNPQFVIDESGEMQAMFSVMDPAWVWARRFVTDAAFTGQTIKGYSREAADRIQLARQWIVDTNAHVGPTLAAVGAPGDYPDVGEFPISQWSFVPLDEGIQTIAAAANGFEWQLMPVLGQPHCAVFTAWAEGDMGDTKPDVIFEYGVGLANTSAASAQINHETMANRFWHATDADPANRVITDQDEDRFGPHLVLETRVDGLDLNGVLGLRQETLAAHKRVRATPQVLWSFTPDVYDQAAPRRVPRPYIDYDIGDWVTIRVVKRRELGWDGHENIGLLDAQMRVYSIAETVDLDGTSQVELGLLPELS